MLDVSRSYSLIQSDMDSGSEGNQILWQSKSLPLTFTYSFLTTIPDYYGSSFYEIHIGDSFDTNTFSGLSQSEQKVIDAIVCRQNLLDRWDDKLRWCSGPS